MSKKKEAGKALGKAIEGFFKSFKKKPSETLVSREKAKLKQEKSNKVPKYKVTDKPKPKTTTRTTQPTKGETTSQKVLQMTKDTKAAKKRTDAQKNKDNIRAGKGMFDSLQYLNKKQVKQNQALKNELAQEKSSLAKFKKVEKEIADYKGTETSSQHVRETVADALPRSSEKAIRDSIKQDKKFEADFDKKFPWMKDKHFQEKLEIKTKQGKK